MKRALLLLLGVVVALGLIFQPAVAQAAQESLTVSPLKGEFKFTPGQQVGSSIKIKNSGEKLIEVEVYAQTFAVKNEHYDQEFYRADNKLAAENWINFDQANYRLEPKKEASINYQIKVPIGAEPGGHYAAIFAQTKPLATSGDDVLQIKRVAHLLYFEIAGQITRGGSIETVKSAFWQLRSPIKSEVRAKNSSNTHYRIDGGVTLRNLFGSEVSKARIEGLLMPGTTRLFTIDNEAPDWPGLYRLETKIGFPDGKSAKYSSWVLYLPPLYIYALGILLFIVISHFVMRKFRQRCHKS